MMHEQINTNLQLCLISSIGLLQSSIRFIYQTISILKVMRDMVNTM